MGGDQQPDFDVCYSVFQALLHTSNLVDFAVDRTCDTPFRIALLLFGEPSLLTRPWKVGKEEECNDAYLHGSGSFNSVKPSSSFDAVSSIKSTQDTSCQNTTKSIRNGVAAVHESYMRGDLTRFVPRTNKKTIIQSIVNCHLVGQQLTHRAPTKNGDSAKPIKNRIANIPGKF